jgi:aminoglycoside 3-N-acetyltransferase
MSYDSAKTPSEVGFFNEYVRRAAGAVRSRHPIFSVAAIGDEAPFLCRNLSRSSFGQGSVFERLRVSDAKILTFDVTLSASCTFAHFSEQYVGVPYRYSKYFRGTAIFEGESTVEDWEFYVRNTECWEFEPNPPGELRYTEALFASGRARTAYWRGLPITVAACRHILDVLTTGIRSDPYYLLPSPPRRKQRPA